MLIHDGAGERIHGGCAALTMRSASSASRTSGLVGFGSGAGGGMVLSAGFPAAGFPVAAKQNGSSLVIINRDPTDLDSYADIVLNKEIGPTLGDVVGVN